MAACVAAASVLAKVTRDRLMVELDAEFPEYGFAEHKGYCTPIHDAALTAHGPSRVHRYSFVNVRAARGDTGARMGAAADGLPAGLVHNDGVTVEDEVSGLDADGAGGLGGAL